MKILAIGNRSTTERLIMALAGNEFEFTTTRELHEAVALLVQEEFHIVLIDSVAVGIETTCRCIRRFKNIPIMLMINQKEPDWKEIARADLDGYVPQWVNGPQLAACLKAVVRRFFPVRQFDQITQLPHLVLEYDSASQKEYF